ncbi:MAG: hypothetical protein HKN18_02655 [Silicimonas sp.]|nr:hypothetical protein [Silicimonas sp.]
MIRIAVIAALTVCPAPLLACACCADPGHRSEITMAVDNLDELAASIGRARIANLYTSACGFDCVQGVTNPEDSYVVTHSADGNTISLTLTGEESSGALTLTLPAVVTLTKADLLPEPGPTTVLYTEYFMDVSIAGSGAFATPHIIPGQLILSGRGNHCTDPSMISHWSLLVATGPANYTLFGALSE